MLTGLSTLAVEIAIAKQDMSMEKGMMQIFQQWGGAAHDTLAYVKAYVRMKIPCSEVCDNSS